LEVSKSNKTKSDLGKYECNHLAFGVGENWSKLLFFRSTGRDPSPVPLINQRKQKTQGSEQSYYKLGG
jgi:hypothetical protein